MWFLASHLDRDCIWVMNDKNMNIPLGISTLFEGENFYVLFSKTLSKVQCHLCMLLNWKIFYGHFIFFYMWFLLYWHSLHRGTKSHLKKHSPPKTQVPPEMTLLKSQPNFQSCIKLNFLFTLTSNICFKMFSMWLELTIDRLIMIGIYWYQSTKGLYILIYLYFPIRVVWP